MNMDDYKCYNCSSNCLTCSDNADSCLTCDEGRILNFDYCVEVCPDKTYELDGKCE